jgi:acyl carrier protein
MTSSQLGAQRAEIEAEVLAAVTAMLGEVIGEGYVGGMRITMDSTFNQELEIESIELVLLAERIRERYGARVDFVGFLADRTIDDLIEMTVGDLVRFIVDCSAGPAPGTVTVPPQRDDVAAPADPSAPADAPAGRKADDRG